MNAHVWWDICFCPMKGCYQRWWAMIMSANRRDLTAEHWMYIACENFRVSEMGMRKGYRNFSARGRMSHKLFRENLQHYVWSLWAGGLTNSLPGATGVVPLEPALQAHQLTIMSSNQQQKPQVDKCRSDDTISCFHMNNQLQVILCLKG